MDINNIHGPKGFDNISNKKSGRVDKSKSGSNGIFSVNDGVEISEEAQEIRKMMSGAKSELLEFIKNSVPDVREVKVQEATEKLSNGFYDRPEVIERLASKLASLF